MIFNRFGWHFPLVFLINSNVGVRLLVFNGGLCPIVRTGGRVRPVTGLSRVHNRVHLNFYYCRVCLTIDAVPRGSRRLQALYDFLVTNSVGVSVRRLATDSVAMLFFMKNPVRYSCLLAISGVGFYPFSVNASSMIFRYLYIPSPGYLSLTNSGADVLQCKQY